MVYKRKKKPNEIKKEINRDKRKRYNAAKRYGFDKTHCSGWVKHYTPEEIAEYDKSLKK